MNYSLILSQVEQFIVDYEQELSESQQFTEELKKEFTVIEEMAEEVIERNETCKVRSALQGKDFPALPAR